MAMASILLAFDRSFSRVGFGEPFLNLDHLVATGNLTGVEPWTRVRPPGFARDEQGEFGVAALDARRHREGSGQR